MVEKWDEKLECAMRVLSDGQWHYLGDLGINCSDNKGESREIAKKAEKAGAIEIREENGGKLEIRGTELINKILELPKE